MVWDFMKNKALLLVPAALAVFALAGCASFAGGPVGNRAVPQPLKAVDTAAYLGKWHEYARYEAPFQKGCEGVTADYSLREDGMIRVVNSCRHGSLDGKFDQSVGKARVVDGSNGAKLKVSFFGPIWGDYWVLDRGEPRADGQYPWSIVGEPSGRFLWLLTRDAKPDSASRELLERRVKELGYDWSLVRMTQQR